MEKTYDPKQIESAVYARWLKTGAFHAEPEGGGAAYCIVIPPPNVTDALHVGHALNNTLQDILIRHHRMAGCNTLWMPGTDHAGIATQTVVEKRILAEEGRRRTDFSRADFVARVQAWKDQYEARILSQLQAFGCSCDWDRTRFTMDQTCAAAVREAFFRLFRDGLIYRGKRLVNWDPATQTVLADDEVEHETVAGHFWYLQYPLVKDAPGTAGVPPATQGAGETPAVPIPEHVTVATTRPETMLGDTAVAINPRDPRAKALLGRQVRLPIVGRLIPIIADEHVVPPDPGSEDEKARFSTGFLKVTPAHDPNDWEIGRRHGLPVVNVLAPDGTISDRHGWQDATTPESQALLGMDRFEAREAVVEWFRKQGLLEEVREYVHEVGHSYRSHVPIEPYLSDQWFIAVKQPIPNLPDKGLLEGTDVPVNSLAGLALKPLLDGELKFFPDRYAAVYRAWLENLRDWPISRQLWWGHRIPVWSGPIERLSWLASRELIEKCRAAGGDSEPVIVPVNGNVSAVLQARNTPQGTIAYVAVPPGHEHIEKQFEEHGFSRDEDVLDTWFSSALWPISTMGWPAETGMLKTFYPSNVLCTAREIITLWVSRMVMFGQYFRGEVPFPHVYIHAMLQDGEGRKMSKSLGNGIDPFDIIASHGADALRFTLAQMTTETQDVRVPVEAMTLPDGRRVNSSPKFDLGRNFCNKLWNAARFSLMNLERVPAWEDVDPAGNLADAWVLSRLNRTAADVTAALEGYRFHDAAGALYRFMWNDFCDWYLEAAKARLGQNDDAPKAVLAHVLDVLLRLLHPFVPFITERIWGQLNAAAPYRGPGSAAGEPALVRAAWPQAQADRIDEAAERRFAELQEIVTGIREARSGHGVPPGRRVRVTIAAAAPLRPHLADSADLIAALAGAETVGFDPAVRRAGGDATVLAAGLSCLIHDVVDVPAERERLGKRQETIRRGIAAAEARLNNPRFREKAPAEVVDREGRRLEEMRSELAAVEKALGELGRD